MIEKKQNLVSALLVSSALLLIALMIQSCGGSDNSTNALVGDYHYQYYDRYTGCTTGYKAAQTRDEFCRMLSDDNQNLDPRTRQVCAHQDRVNDFATNCPGYQWPNP